MSESRAMLLVDGIELPSPISIKVDDELIWSEDSGRDLSGLFSGDVIAEKKTVTVEWGFLTEEQVVVLQDCLCAGYFSLTFSDAGGNITIDSYRATLSKVLQGYIGDGILYYKSVSCKIVQR